MIFGILAIVIGLLMVNTARRLFRIPPDPRSPRQRKAKRS